MPIEAYEKSFLIQNFCLNDPLKLLREEAEVLEKFDISSSFIDRVSCLMPVLSHHYSVCPLKKMWPMDRNLKNNDKSSKYRVAGNKAFVSKDYEKVGTYFGR